jgi:phosphoribosyl-dephospho-CoA transferase
VWAATQLATNANGSDTTEKWKSDANTTMKEILACNGDRVHLAHSLLQPHADGSVSFTRVNVDGGRIKGREPVTWSQNDFATKTNRVNELTQKLRAVRNSLETFTIVIPDAGSVDMSWFVPFSQPINNRRT